MKSFEAIHVGISEVGLSPNSTLKWSPHLSVLAAFTHPTKTEATIAFEFAGAIVNADVLNKFTLVTNVKIFYSSPGTW